MTAAERLMNTVQVTESASTLRAAVVDFVSKASVEIAVHDEQHLPALAAHLRGGTPVYVSFTPNAVITSYSIHYTKLYEVQEKHGLARAGHLQPRVAHDLGIGVDLRQGQFTQPSADERAGEARQVLRIRHHGRERVTGDVSYNFV